METCAESDPYAERCSAYATVAEAIGWLRAHAREQPSLADLAAHLGRSECHLQRLFAAWAGISPKRFLQVMARRRAHAALAGARDVLEAAYEAGLSGPGRLHDLLVSCDGVTPGELRAAGAGLDLAWGLAPTPFGEALIGFSARGVCHLAFLDVLGGDGEREAQALAARWPAARLVRDDASAAALSRRIFAPAAAPAPLHLCVRGTNFQVQVWEALLRIPPGRTLSYAQLAVRVGAPGAARAVGRAVGANPIAYLIPCHRVVRGDGDLAGYRWGVARKQALLAWEQAVERHGELAV